MFNILSLLPKLLWMHQNTVRFYIESSSQNLHFFSWRFRFFIIIIFSFFQMPRETLKIVSMNLTKAGRQHQSYLRQLLDNEQPDLCLLPGDNDNLKKAVVFGYEQYVTQGNQQTVLLYKAEKLKLNWSPVSTNQYPQLPGVNFDHLVCPEAVVELGPYQEPRRFSILTWHYSLTQWNGIDRTTQATNIVGLSQNIALTRQIPIFIGGDFNVDLNTMEKLVKHVSSEGTKSFLEQAQSSGQFPSNVWLPSMIKGTLTPQRHLIAMNVYSCKQNTSVVAQYGSQQQSDYFIASKSILLQETSLVDFGSATGKTTKVEKYETAHATPTMNGTSNYTPTMNGTSNYTPTKNETSYYTPTKTIMSTQPRPPKHYGG